MGEIICGECKSSEIILQEYMGAYDGWMSIVCEACGAHTHRSGGKIKSFSQREDYGAVDFVMEDGRILTNLFPYEPNITCRFDCC